MLNKLVFENLKHRPVRTLLSVVAVAIEVTMILTLVGVSRGMLDDSQRRAKGVGADIWVKPPNSQFISFGSTSMPEKMVEYFEKQPHVVIATGSVMANAGLMEPIGGVDIEKFGRMSGGFRFLEGGPIRKDGDIIIDERFASIKKLKVGSKYELWNRTWNVSGIFESGKLARLVLPIKTVQELQLSQGKVSQIFLKLDDPSKTDQVIAQLKSIKELEGYPIYSMEELTSLYSINNIPGLRTFIYVVITLGVVVGFLVVFLSMYTAVLERTREIGILKSLGASPGFIIGILLRETAILAVTGSIAGIALTYGTQFLINTFAGPALSQMTVPDWWPITSAIAITGAMLGTLYPGLKAVRQDALEALSYD